HLRAIFVYSIADGKSHQITDGLADSISPAFDAGGKYLYFLSSTDYGPRTGWLEMSSLDRPVRRAIYLAVLGSTEPSPLLPELGDEPKPAGEEGARPKADANKNVTVRIDFDKISQRIISLSAAPADYGNLTAGVAGTVFYTEPTSTSPAAPLRLMRY